MGKITDKNLTNRGGRPKGSKNKTTGLLKEAILQAAGDHGYDGKGMDGLKGYCQHLAAQEPKAFAQLLGKVMPLQVAGPDGGSLVVKIVA